MLRQGEPNLKELPVINHAASVCVLSAVACVMASWVETSFAAEPNCSEPSLSQEIYECSKIERAQADDALNRAYKNLIERIEIQYASNPELGSDLKKNLVMAQKTWGRLRDADCSIEAFVVEAQTQAHDAIINNCIARMSNLRKNHLDQLIKYAI